MNTKAIWSSNSDEWATPQDFYNKLNEEFDFNLDPCANDANHKTEEYFTAEVDGLSKNWGGGTEYSAIRHIAKLANGLRNVMKKPKNPKRSWCC